MILSKTYCFFTEIIMSILRVYHPREPKESVLWQILNRHYEDFEKSYEEKFEKKYGFFRPVIGEVVRAYLRCGDLKDGFARVRCYDCGYEFLLQLICYSYYTSFDLRVIFQFLAVKFLS